jgi:hypothetical protein
MLKPELPIPVFADTEASYNIFNGRVQPSLQRFEHFMTIFPAKHAGSFRFFQSSPCIFFDGASRAVISAPFLKQLLKLASALLCIPVQRNSFWRHAYAEG